MSDLDHDSGVPPESLPAQERHRRFPTFSLFSISLVLVALAGGIFGLGTFTFSYAEGHSYFSNNPESCVNCHVMREVYDAWHHSSHGHVAVCNDCHSPHVYPYAYVIKGINGWNHSVAFTTGEFPEPIRITELNRQVALNNCIYCHGDFVVPILAHETAESPTDCLHCHTGVGHPH
jgi:cytochrome c nitrite reductase small subunit